MQNQFCTARVEAIWLKRAKRGPMDAVASAIVDVGYGLRGNANRGGRRQVTIISRQRWAELAAALNADLDPRIRRANLMISGVDLAGSVADCSAPARPSFGLTERHVRASRWTRRTLVSKR